MMQSCFLQELKPCLSQTAGSMLCSVTRHAGLSLSGGSVLSQSSTMSSVCWERAQSVQPGCNIYELWMNWSVTETRAG